MQQQQQQQQNQSILGMSGPGQVRPNSGMFGSNTLNNGGGVGGGGYNNQRGSLNPSVNNSPLNSMSHQQQQASLMGNRPPFNTGQQSNGANGNGLMPMRPGLNPALTNMPGVVGGQPNNNMGNSFYQEVFQNLH